VGQGWILRGALGGVEGTKLLSGVARMLVAAALMGAASYGAWYALDAALGDELVAQIVSVLLAIAVGLAVYAATVWALRVPEAHQIRRLLVSRGRGEG
jgi:peptidoglycan biosynthesis protein MviN/MurJ (putative lipid II flippase)